jgi:DNA repair protein RadC
MSQWPAAERPREKLVAGGPQALSDAELLAVVIGSGTGGRSALDIARGILISEQGLRGISTKNCSELMRVKGIGRARAVALVAAFEMGRRMQSRGWEEHVSVNGPADVARVLLPLLRDRLQEVFVVLILDSKNGIKLTVEISRGTLNASLVHPREVFKCAIDHSAAAIIVAHNHPSGNCEPSREDIEITRQLAEAGKIVGIPLHDHVILAGNGYASMAERGIL